MALMVRVRHDDTPLPKDAGSPRTPVCVETVGSAAAMASSSLMLMPLPSSTG